MMLRSLLLLPALVAAREHGVKGVHRQLQAKCTDLAAVTAAVTTCETSSQENQIACYGDDPAGEICAADNGSGLPPFNDPGLLDVDPSVYCKNIQNYYCASKDCCKGKCNTEYQAFYQCQADLTAFSCGPLSCTSPTPAPVPTPVPATPAPTAPPSCFSATSTVQVLGQGPVQMQNLQVGDQVLTGSPGNYKYQSVYAFGHLNKETLGTFYAIGTKGSKKPLEMTGEHLVYLAGKHNPVRAASLMVGDTLLSTRGPTEITSIRTVKKQGLFNPLTADGRLVVDDIAVSTYIALQDNDQEHFQVVFDNKGDIKFNVISHHNFVHLYLAPFRMLCMGISSQLCQVHDAEGIPLYISYGMKLVQWVGQQNVLIQLVFLMVTFPIVLFFLAMEKLVGSSVAPLAIFAGAVLATRAPKYLSLKKTKVV